MSVNPEEGVVGTRRGTKSPRTWERKWLGNRERRGCAEGGEVLKDHSICSGMLGLLQGWGWQVCWVEKPAVRVQGLRHY